MLKARFRWNITTSMAATPRKPYMWRLAMRSVLKHVLDHECCGRTTMCVLTSETVCTILNP